MAPAIFTHGGGEAGFNPRIRIPAMGVWDWFRNIALLNADRDLVEYDLAGNRKEEQGESYGIGYKEDRHLFAFRYLQVWEQNRERKYPYTLLLDIGGGLWKHLSWDAASIAAFLTEGESIVGGGGTLQSSREGEKAKVSRDLLLRRPEGIADESALGELCSGLVDAVLKRKDRPRPVTTDPIEGNDTAERLRHFWAGSVLEDSPVEIPLSHLGLDRRPTPDRLVEYLDLLPVCLKVGHGWMLGLPAFASEIGARLTITKISGKPPAESVERIITAGRQLLAGWRLAASHPAIVELMVHLGETPFREWENRNVLSFLQRIRTLGALNEAAGWGKDAEEAVESGLSSEQELGSLISNALDALLERGGDTFGPPATKYVLNRLAFGGEPPAIGPGIMERLHPETLAQELLRKGFPYTGLSTTYANILPPAVISLVWRLRLAEAPPEAACSTVEEALRSPYPPPENSLADFMGKAIERASEGRASVRDIDSLVTRALDHGGDAEWIACFLIGKDIRRGIELPNKKRLASVHEAWRALACLEVFWKAFLSGKSPHDDELNPLGILSESEDHEHRFSAFWDEVRRLQATYWWAKEERKVHRAFEDYFQMAAPPIAAPSSLYPGKLSVMADLPSPKAKGYLVVVEESWGQKAWRTVKSIFDWR